MYQVKTIGRAVYGRHVSTNIYHFDTAKTAMIKVMEVLSQNEPMMIVLLINPKGEIILNKGFHTQGGLQ